MPGSQPARALAALIVLGLGFAWTLGGLLLFVLSLGFDACPQCGARHRYYRADAGRLLHCRRCRAAWPASSSKP